MIQTGKGVGGGVHWGRASEEAAESGDGEDRRTQE